MSRFALHACVAIAIATPAAADLAEIKQRGVLRVLVSADEMVEMFNFEDRGEPGLEREMIEAFARAHGLTVEVVRIASFETIIPSLLAGQGDVITGIIDTAPRRRQVAFTAETLPARHVAVTRAPLAPVKQEAELATRRVAVVTGTSWEDAAIQAGVPETLRKGFPTAHAALDALRGGGVEAMVMSLPDFAHAQRSDPELHAGSFVGPAASAAWAVRPDDVKLRKALDDYIRELRRSPSWSRMVLRYFSEGALRLVGQSRQ
jgi:ABC-type amino acid transport substrate-binding protein